MWKILLGIGVVVGAFLAWNLRGDIDAGLDHISAWKLERRHIEADEAEKQIVEGAANDMRKIDSLEDGLIDDVFECMLRTAGKDVEAKRMCDAMRKHRRHVPATK